ncbi:MAG: hypothetical protein ACHRXM_33975 [Isosphaerales bacterium]
MSAKPLLPQAFWFRIAVPCPRIEGMPRAEGAGRLLDLPESSALPDLRQLDGGSSWARVRVGWNPGGLGIAVLGEGVSSEQLDKDRPEGFAAAQFWVDTRDTRNVSRATRFCHRFMAELRPGNARGQLDVKVAHLPIAQATTAPPLCSPEHFAVRAELSRSGWMLELFLPADALNGFDHELNRRLGFAYHIADYVRDDQFFTVGREFPVGENPSLWSTLELRD